MTDVTQAQKLSLTLPRETLLKPLNLVAGVADKKQTMEVLSNLLFRLDGRNLSIVGTDTEIELICRLVLPQTFGSNTQLIIPARKLWDICKALPEDAQITFNANGNRLSIQSGRSRFALSLLGVHEFPSFALEPAEVELTLNPKALREALNTVQYAMAQQDVRYYLNGMLFELNQNTLTVVATDGHRLVSTQISAMSNAPPRFQSLIPRKAITELIRLLNAEDDEVLKIVFGKTYIKVMLPDMEFTSRLIDGRFPDYRSVIPNNTDVTILIDRNEFKSTLQRVSILSNEKFRGVRLLFEASNLTISANNPEREEAEDQIAVDYAGEKLELAFNVNYLLEALSAMQCTTVQLCAFSNATGSILLRPQNEDAQDIHVIMPLCL